MARTCLCCSPGWSPCLSCFLARGKEEDQAVSIELTLRQELRAHSTAVTTVTTAFAIGQVLARWLGVSGKTARELRKAGVAVRARCGPLRARGSRFAATASTSEHTASQRAENRSGERIRVPTVQPADTWFADMVAHSGDWFALLSRGVRCREDIATHADMHAMW